MCIRDSFKEGVDDGRQTAYLYKSLNNMFKFYLGEGDGIQDNEWEAIKTIDGFLFINKPTREFFTLELWDDGLYHGKFKGNYLEGYIFDDTFVIRNTTRKQEIFLTIKL